MVSILKPIHIVVPTPIQVKVIFLKEQIQHPQELVPLRRSTKERRKAILDDIIIFIREHEENYGILKDDQIIFHQAMKSSYSHRLINLKKKILKDSFITIMTLVALFYLELHQMDSITSFHNDDIKETIYMVKT